MRGSVGNSQPVSLRVLVKGAAFPLAQGAERQECALGMVASRGVQVPLEPVPEPR